MKTIIKVLSFLWELVNDIAWAVTRNGREKF